MYSEIPEFEGQRRYFQDSDCFSASSMHMVHAYMHANYRYRMHAHQFYEMNIVAAGEGVHYIGDSQVPARVGDVFIIPPETGHGYRANEALDICHVLLRTDFMQSYHKELSQLPAFALLFDIEPQIRRTSGRGYNLHVEHRELAEVMQEFSRIVQAEAEGEYAYQNVLTLSLIGGMGLLLRQTLQGEKLPAQAGELLRVMEYIQNNIGQKLTLESLAAVANMSKATLHRHFRETLRVSPMQYVMQCRLARARELLLKKECSKTAVAHLCGFFDVAHMNKYL